MAYRIAGIDVHKKKLAVVVADVEVEDEYPWERRWSGSNPEQLQRLAEWLSEQQVEEVVTESTAQYWKPVWGALERYWKPSCEKREGAGTGLSSVHAPNASRSCVDVARKRWSAKAAKATGSVSPSAKACSIRRALAPSRSETKLDNLIRASSSRASS